jgi:hypothetical protein
LALYDAGFHAVFFRRGLCTLLSKLEQQSR